MLFVDLRSSTDLGGEENWMRDNENLHHVIHKLVKLITNLNFKRPNTVPTPCH